MVNVPFFNLLVSTMLKGKFMTENAYTKKEEWSPVNNLWNFMELEKKNKTQNQWREKYKKDKGKIIQKRQ